MFNQVKIIAHRGASGLCGQDNTLASFELAIHIGCDMIELDVRQTSDGQLVCFHDPYVNDIPVAEMTFEKLLAQSDVQVPTFKQAVQLCRSQIALNVEIKKSGYEQQVLETLLPTMSPDDFNIECFKPQVVTELGRLNAAVSRGLLVDHDDKTPITETLNTAANAATTTAAAFLSVHHSLIGDDLFAHPVLGKLPVYCWTVDDPIQMRQVLQYPVAAIVTNRPDYALHVLDRTRPEVDAKTVQHSTRNHSPQNLMAQLVGANVQGVELPTHHVHIAPGALADIADLVNAFHPGRPRCAVVADANTRHAAGETVLKNLDNAFAVEVKPLPGWELVTPDDQLGDDIARRCQDSDILISVGSGTINDLTKYAAQKLDRPYITVPTAASVNGYTSDLAVITVNGLKANFPARPPVAVLADIDVLAAAPPEMAQSGYADLLSKPMSETDWKLASWIVDDSFNQLPGSIVSAALDDCLAVAEDIRDAQPQAVEVLIRALVLSGFSMTVAGKTSPASGAEHLISHYWDMTAHLHEQPSPASHGFQVALGTILTSRLYDLMRKQDPATFQPRCADLAVMIKAHGQLWPAISDEATQQILTPKQAAQRLQKITRQWDRMWADLDDIRCSSQEIQTRLIRGGIPTTPGQLGIEIEQVRHALRYAADMRNRYTVLHLAQDTNCLDRLIDQVISSDDL